MQTKLFGSALVALLLVSSIPAIAAGAKPAATGAAASGASWFDTTAKVLGTVGGLYVVGKGLCCVYRYAWKKRKSPSMQCAELNTAVVGMQGELDTLKTRLKPLSNGNGLPKGMTLRDFASGVTSDNRAGFRQAFADAMQRDAKEADERLKQKSPKKADKGTQTTH